MTENCQFFLVLHNILKRIQNQFSYCCDFTFRDMADFFLKILCEQRTLTTVSSTLSEPD